MFILALFKIAQTRKQQRCPSVGELIIKLRYSQTIGIIPYWKKKKSYQAMKRHKGVLNTYY